MEKSNKNNSGKLLLIILILLTIAAAGGGFFAYKFYFLQQGPNLEMANIDLKEKTIAFIYKYMPDVYNCLFDLNHEVVIIDNEMERLTKIEKEFPKQKKIVLIEKKMWTNTRKTLTTTIANLEKSIETIYVAYTINSEKGADLIETQNAELLASATGNLGASKEKTERLKNMKKKNFMDKIKEKLSK